MLQNPDTQIASCCRALVRYIIKQGLTFGEKLPAQEELRKLLNYSHNSMSPAMNLLVDSGMLERKPKIGTIINDPKSFPAGLWRIAFPFGMLDNTPRCQFETILIRYLQEKCFQAKCHMRFYILNVDKVGIVPHEFSDFGLLQNDLEAGRVDGILTPAFFSAESSIYAAVFSVPLCNVGGWQETPLRVSIAFQDVIIQGIGLLDKKGCKSISVIFDRNSQKEVVDFIDNQIIKDQKYKNLQIKIIDTGNLKCVEEIVGSYKENEASRPDGLIVLNDNLALELTTRLRDLSFSPEVIVQSNKQIPLFFPMPVIKIEFDIEELADAGVSLLMDRILSFDLDGGIKTIKPKVIV